MRSTLTPTVLNEKEFADELAPGVELLQGQYVIEAHLNSGGFGITYLAKDSLHRRVVIKECFPGAFCRRSKAIVGVRSRAHAKEFRTIVDLFVQEARQLARLRHPNIVGVHQVFLDNDTAYMALDYVEGSDLLEILEDPSKKLSPKDIQEMTLKLLDAIEFIHGQGILHRDISPDNILLSKNKEPVLIDFGAARETATRATRLLGAMRTVKDGYSPQEFYLSDAAQHASSDLYSLGASLYHLMTGETPPNAQERLSAVACEEPDPYLPIAPRVSNEYSPAFLDAIDKSLSVFPKHRVQTAAEWRAMITHSRATSVTRGSVSRPMLAVDNGNVVAHIRDLVRDDQLATKEELQDAGLVPDKSGKPRRARPDLSSDPRTPDAEAVDPARNVRAMPEGKKSGMSLGLVAGVLMVAVAGGAAYVSFSGSGNEQVASIATPSVTAPAAPVEDSVSAPSAPVEEAVAAAPAAQVAEETASTQPVPEVEETVEIAAAAPIAEPTPPVAEAAVEEPVDAPVASAPEAEEPVAETPEIALSAVTPPPARPVQTEPDTVATAPAEPEISGVAPEVVAEVGEMPVLAGEENYVEVTGTPDVIASRDAPVIALAPQPGSQPAIDAAAPPPPPAREETVEIMDLTAVISGPAVNFPFAVDGRDTTLIASVEDGAPGFLRPGLRVVSVNGFPVENFADAQQIVKATRSYRIGDEISVDLGIEDTRSGEAFVRPMALPTVQETILLNGTRFRTELTDGAWKTVVVETPGRGLGGFQEGDVVVALMPASELIDKPAALAQIIQRELAESVTKFNFAVMRNGEMYLVSMSYSGVGN